MFAVVLRILLRAAFTLLLLTACVFFGLHLTGDPARIMLGNAADEVALEAFRAQWGLNLPLWQQFLVYLEKFVSLDMGTSYMTGQPVKEVFLDALGPTLSLMIPTAVATLLIGIPSAAPRRSLIATQRFQERLNLSHTLAHTQCSLRQRRSQA